MNATAKRAKSIFMAMVRNVARDQWSRHLDVACGEDHDLRREVDSLLKAHLAADSFLAQPAAHVVLTSAQHPITEQPGDTIGPYTLVEQIGEGGMGVVYRAKQSEPIKRSVALKVIKPGMDSETVIARFQAERQALALMDHPSIAHVLDAGTTDSGRPFFVMGLVKGIPITDYCDGCAYSTRDRLELFVRVCQAVNHAHERGIIHRDVKPSNVLIEMRDGEPSPKVIDFGVAKAMGQRLTEHTLTTGFAQMLGTPMYMSPEQAEMSPVDVDVRSDVYSLGVLLYQLLTGITPFDEERLRTSSFDELRRIIREEDPPRPSTRLSTLGAQAETIAEHRRTQPHWLERQLRGDLDWIVMKALEKDPRHRYPSANALAADVQRSLDNRPTIARPPSLSGRAIKWSRRHTALVMSTAAVLLVSTIALAISTALILSAYHRESTARESETEARGGERAALSQATEHLRETERARDRARRTAYVADMRFAFRQYSQGLLHDARTLLDAQIPEDGFVDLRGLEWHALSTQIDLRYQTLGQHDGLVADIDFFPDGHTFATAGGDGVVRVWDADSLSMVREFRLQDRPVYTVGVSPDGRWLAYGAGSRDNPELKRVILLDAQTDAILGTTNRHDTTIRQVRFSPDGRFLASASLQEKVSVWQFTDGVTGRSYNLTEPYADAENFEIQFIDERSLLTESPQRTGYRVWNVETGEPIHDYPGLDPNNVAAPSWCKRQSAMAYVPLRSSDHHTYRRVVHLLDTSSGREIGQFNVGDVIECLELSPEGDVICVGTESGHIHTLAVSFSGDSSDNRHANLSAGQPLQVHDGSVMSLRFLDETRVISGGADGRVVLFRLGGMQTKRSPFGGNDEGVVTKMAASPDGDFIAWSGTDGRVRLADPLTGRVFAETQPLSAPPMELTWSGDGTHLAAICKAGEFGCWRIESQALVECVRDSIEDFAHHYAGLALCHDGSMLYVSGDRGLDGIHVWDVRAQAKVGFRPTIYVVRRLVVSPDDSLLVAAGEEIYILDRQSNSLQHQIRAGGVCTSLQFAPDGQILVAGYKDGVVRLWNPDSGKLERVLPEYDRDDAAISAFVFSQDGRTLIAGCSGSSGQLRFWNTDTWDYLGNIHIVPIRNWIHSIALTPEADAIDLVVGASELQRRFVRIPLTADEHSSME